MSELDKSVVYEFGPFRVDPLRRQLSRDDTPLPITSKAFETLIFLVHRNGMTVTKRDLIDAIWAETAVEENNLTQQISTLRKALEERSGERRFIVTIPGKGYSFVAPVRTVPSSGESLPQNSGGRDTELFETRPGLNESWVSRYGYQPITAAVVVFLILITIVFWSNLRQAVSPKPHTIAVLPFRSPDGSDDFLGAGMSDTLTAKLGNLQELNVRPTNSTVRYGGLDPLVAGRELNVDAILDGTIQRNGGQVRVTVQMLDVANGRIVWGGSFNETASDMFSAQDSITAEVVSMLQKHMSPSSQHAAGYNANSYQAY